MYAGCAVAAADTLYLYMELLKTMFFQIYAIFFQLLSVGSP